jgi:hypothetical protein
VLLMQGKKLGEVQRQRESDKDILNAIVDGESASLNEVALAGRPLAHPRPEEKEVRLEQGSSESGDAPFVRVDAHMADEITSARESLVATVVGAGERATGSGAVLVNKLEDIHRRAKYGAVVVVGGEARGERRERERE